MIVIYRKVICEQEIQDIIETRKNEEKIKITKAIDDMQEKFEQNYINK